MNSSPLAVIVTHACSALLPGFRRHAITITLAAMLALPPGPAGAARADGAGRGAIQNDPGTPDLSIEDASIAEGNADTRILHFTVSLSHPTDQVVTVHYQTSDGTATLANQDYVDGHGDVAIPAKETVATVSVVVNGDLVFEPDETFTVVLSNPVNATIADGIGQGTILNVAAIREDFYATNGLVNATALDGNTLYIGGSFTSVGPATGGGVPIDVSTGLPIPGFPKVVGTVQTVVADGSGGWYIGGTFTSVGGVARANLARIRSDMTVSGWNPGTNGIVQTLSLDGTSVYASGGFNTVGGQTRGGLAELDAESGLPTAWNPSPNNQVSCIQRSGSTVYASGVFTAIGGQTRNGIAALDATTGLATSWNANSNGGVVWFALNGSTLYAGGIFTAIGGQARNSLAALSTTTGLATAWNPNPSDFVNGIAVSGSTVYVGGAFTTIGGQARNRIAALDATTGLATAWNPNANANVGRIEVSGATVYVVGSFTSIGGQPRFASAALDAATGLATAWNPGPNSTVYAQALSGTAVYLGGLFTSVGGQPRNRIAALDVTTGLPTAWNPGASGTVNALAVNGGTIYAGGAFTTIGGESRHFLAALDATTGLASAWDPNPNLTSGVLALAVNGTTVYAGGSFTTIGGQSRNSIAALDASTGLATSWDPDASGRFFGAGAAIVNALAVSGTTVFAGGNFTAIGGQSRSGIAELDESTGLATAWNPSANNVVNTLATGGSTVYAGGSFTSLGGQARNRIAALDAATGLATAWNPNANSTVSALAAAGNTVYAGGSFTTIGGQTRNRIASLNAVTGSAASWDPNVLGGVSALAAGAGVVYAGGNFTAVGGLPQSYLAAIESADEPPRVSIGDVTMAEGSAGPASAVFTISLSGTTGMPVTVEYQTHDGTATTADSDFVAVSGTATLDPKTLSTTVAVTVKGDRVQESDETFTITLSNPANATLADSIGLATLQNDDNAPPAIPSPFTGVFLGGPAQLHWGANTEPDFAFYRLYRDTTEDFVPGPGNLLVSQPDTGYVDTSSVWSYYKLSAVDSSGNESGFALLIPASTSSGVTPSGSNVPVAVNPSVQVTFQNVSSGGLTQLTMQTGGTIPPNGLKLAPGSPKLYYVFSSTASFTGTVTICITYNPANVGNESNLKMMHYDTAGQPPGWVEVTASRNPASNTICGTVTHFSEFALMEADPTVDVKEAIPSAFRLYSCAPNPVSGPARVAYDLPVTSPVRLSLFDLQGRLVRELERQPRVAAGRHEVQWDGRGAHGEHLRAGIYFLWLETAGSRQMRRVVVMR